MRTIVGIAYQHFLKPLLFRIEPERVHTTFLRLGKLLGEHGVTRQLVVGLCYYSHPVLEQEILRLTFKNPVGLSAGFDKDADLVRILPAVGFGYAELGSVTSKSYEGNPPPRLYRLPESRGLVVNYGLKNLGADEVIDKLKNVLPVDMVTGISVAKTNSSETVSDEDGIADYCRCLEKLCTADVGDFYTINISCPNTFGGEPFTTPDKLNKLLEHIVQVECKKPLFVKMPVDLAWDEFKELLDVIVDYGVDGVVIGNLTKNRESELILDEIPENIKGGISGVPTRELSNNLIEKTYQAYGERLVIVGVGGIFTAEDAYEKIKCGASLVQLITGMVYCGPQAIGQINEGLVKLLRADGYKDISEAVGAYHRSS